MGFNINIAIHSSDDLPRFESCELFLKMSSPRAGHMSSPRAGHGKCIFVPWGVFPRIGTNISDLITHKGIVSEFYIRYWYLIKEELTHVIKHIFHSNSLAPSQQRAMLTLLYKKGEREDITNWRPISLLNVDYKIITKLLAGRLKPLLPNIIHPDQKGYVNGRTIFEANRLLKDVIDYSEENRINSSIIFLDYQKAFDQVEWAWALQCLEKFNFGPKFIQWIHMIYKNAKTCLLTNEHRSCYFPISRSMRQGCPVSPLIFILQTEPLACAIRKNTNIIGFPLPNAAQDNQAQDNHEQKQVKINAYVDDAQVFNSTENYQRKL